jgi:Saxitoxin biosynthesis operon protein SxtJ
MLIGASLLHQYQLINGQMTQTIHESYSRDETVIGGSDRSFGIVMTAAFAAMSLLNWWHNGHSWRWTGGIAVLFFAAALLYPAALKPFNRVWLKFGLLLHKVVNPIVMALVFFGTVLPTGLIMRALGKDPLRLKWQPDANSYWIERRPPGPAPESMKDQF